MHERAAVAAAEFKSRFKVGIVRVIVMVCGDGGKTELSGHILMVAKGAARPFASRS